MISRALIPYYSLILTLTFTCLAIGKYIQYNPLRSERVLHGNNTNYPLTYIGSVLLIIFIGLRPISGYFGDMITYQYMFYDIGLAVNDGDWMFYSMMKLLRPFTDASGFFLVVAIGYVGFVLVGFRLLFKNNTSAALILFLTAFSFKSYALNGIRNGFATSMFLLGFCIILSQTIKRNQIIGLIICLLSINFHRSLALPLICMIAAFYIRKYNTAVIFWFVSILLYLVAHGAIESFFSSLGFDDRLSTYIENADEYAARGFKTGFRPDFLLYSAMPIWLGYIVNVKHKIEDRTFQWILNTYIFANAFWCMIQGASFSNRFAYLSWFMYPLVLAYPCFKFNVWHDQQGKITANIIMINAAFTFFMTFFYNG